MKNAINSIVFPSLVKDCLEVVGLSRKEDIDSMLPFIRYIAAVYAAVRPDVYGCFRDLEQPDIMDFLKTYCEDVSHFGRKCPTTKHVGMKICSYAAALARNESVLDTYVDNVLIPLCVFFSSQKTEPDKGRWSYLLKVYSSLRDQVRAAIEAHRDRVQHGEGLELIQVEFEHEGGVS
jgi:hypothetical protein